MAISDRDKEAGEFGGIVVGVLAVSSWCSSCSRGGGGEEAATVLPPVPRHSAPGGTGGAQGSESRSLAPTPVLVLRCVTRS